jgi:Sulfatase-modifying factor enzyme 1/Domain of unknown function (DUF4062)
MARQCAVFVSSTIEDLREFRLAAREGILAVALRPEMYEYFAATGGPALRDCLARVSPCDVAVVIVAERYGWVPPDQPTNEAKSITWLECQHAAGRECELLVFFPADLNAWPKDRTEAFRLADAAQDGTFTAKLAEEVQRNIARLKDFRSWLQSGRVRATFTTPDDLKAKVTQALFQWLDRHPDCRPSRPGLQNPRTYLEWLRDQTSTIDIRGLGEGAGRARNFPIEELYIPLTTPSYPAERLFPPAVEERKPMLLEEALEHRRLVIVGDPGSGKTTFLRRIAYEMAKDALEGTSPLSDASPSSESEFGGMLTRLSWCLPTGRNTAAASSQVSFPIFIRVADLIHHIDEARAGAGNQAFPDPEDPAWIGRFLATRNTTFGWGLSIDCFLEKLNSGEAVVMFDGLDEAPDPQKRERASRLFEHATSEYRKSRFVVTTRPQSFLGQGLLADFNEARIEPLDDEAIHTFLDRWCRGIYPESRLMAEQHRDELAGALRAVPEIRKMTRNPVMLTALAVVHWNEKRIPEQRADLYDSILKWLSQQREKRPSREKPERCLALLAELAFVMQNHPRGRQLGVGSPWAAEALAAYFGPGSKSERSARAARFLEDEMTDSGIIVSRGGQLQFWHLTFQEYLAATSISGKPDQEQKQLLFDQGKAHRPEWRETVLLLAGVLYGNGVGKPKVDILATAILDRAGSKLADQARAADLLGAIVNDLKPFDYDPPDPARYHALMDATLGVFEKASVNRVEFAVRLAAAEALGQAGDPRLNRENWIRIEGRKSGLKAFEIGQYPVTVQEYTKFVDAGGYRDNQWWKAGGFGKESQPRDWDTQKEHPNRPVTNVNWYEAAAYAAWAGAWLLSEAEWEWAARGEKGREYPWGNEGPDATRANYRDTGPKQPTSVGLYPWGATPEGVEDMVGNVWEWTGSWYDEKHTTKALRGGSWDSGTSDLRASVRIYDVPEIWNYSFGFRVARRVPVP